MFVILTWLLCETSANRDAVQCGLSTSIHSPTSVPIATSALNVGDDSSQTMKQQKTEKKVNVNSNGKNKIYFDNSLSHSDMLRQFN